MNAVNRDALQVRVTEIDQSIEDQLYLAASVLTAEAQQVGDPRLLELLMHTSSRIVAVARVYARLQTIDLLEQNDIVASLPDLCEELHACFDGGRALPNDRYKELRLPDTRPSPPPVQVLGELVANEATQAALQERRSMCVELEHDGCSAHRLTIGEGAPSAAPAESTVSGRLRSLLAKLAASLGQSGAQPGATISVRFG